MCISEYRWGTKEATVACKQLQLAFSGEAIQFLHNPFFDAHTDIHIIKDSK